MSGVHQEKARKAVEKRESTRWVMSAVASGLRRGAHSGWYLVKIIVPLSAGVALLQWTGILAWIGRILSPVMRLFGLPGEAAVALVSGYFAGVYGGVAAAAAMPLTRAQITVLAIMVLVAHNLVVETAIQSRSGTSGPRVTVVRIATASILGALLWQLLRLFDSGGPVIAHALVGGEDSTFAAFVVSWASGAAMLVLKIFVIVTALMIATEMMRAGGVFEALLRPMRPVMRLLGLSERVTFLWLTATFLGLSYGAGLIIEEAREAGRFRRGDLRDLHVSIGISHSLLEDTILFAAVGASPLWIVLPRPIAAAVAVRVVRRLVTRDRDRIETGDGMATTGERTTAPDARRLRWPPGRLDEGRRVQAGGGDVRIVIGESGQLAKEKSVADRLPDPCLDASRVTVECPDKGESA